LPRGGLAARHRASAIFAIIVERAMSLSITLNPPADIIPLTIEKNPRRAFMIFVLVHVILWTIVPWVLCSSLPLDVSEAVAYGRDWQFGYWKHPPLPWLLVDITHQIFGGQLWAYFFLGQLAVIICFWALWRLGCEILNPLQSFVAVILLDGCIVFNIRAMEFNHNIAQLPFFALAGWSLYRAFLGGRLLDWLLVGVWFGLAFNSKYEAIVLLAPALLFAVVNAPARQCWKGPGPYLAALVCAALFAPHAIWALGNDLSTFNFFNERAQPANSLLALLRVNLVFAVNALLLILPILILFVVLCNCWFMKPPAALPSDRFARRYLTFMAFGPLATTLVAGLILGREFPSIWAMQFWCFFPLYLISVWRPTLDLPALRRLSVGWIVFTTLCVVVEIAAQVFLVASGALMTTIFPGAQFSALVTEAWHSEVDTPLSYVIGGYWEAGNVILHSPDRPRFFSEGNSHFSPRIDLADVQRRGAVILLPAHQAWNDAPPPSVTAPWLKQFAKAELRDPFVISRNTPRGELVWSIGWAILKPSQTRAN
jgi:4-amino-4-deoxy-L-arabinose transferase-like glycosyltransferase